MKIEVLGSGCSKCKRLEKNVKVALKQTGMDAEVVKVEDINEIVNRGVMLTPALIVDGAVISTGKALAVDQIIKLLNK